MSTMTYITMGASLAILAATVVLYNRLIALSRRCEQAFADIDVQLKQRHDLVPNLVETVKGYAKHERATLEAVMQARSAAMQPASPAAHLQAETALGATLGRLFALAEAYPDLKASANFSHLAQELGDIEDKIAAARRFLNGAVSEYNASLEQIPANLVALLFGMEPKVFFDLGTETRTRLEIAPAVQL